jgi:uncharacterized Zn finger protein
MSYYAWKPYVSVAERRKKAEKVAAKIKKSGGNLSPIEPYRGAIAKTFWGKAWCDNLEAYSDYANRLPRGRTYVRNGSVIDLQIAEGEVQAKVMGSSLYQVTVRITPVAEKHWQAIGKDCAGSIDSLVELLQGKLSTAVMQRICKPKTGLFPEPKEITVECTCPDWADMCKHVAAVLYGVGARLDQKPELLFGLRRVDAKDLVTQAGVGLPKSKTESAGPKVLDDDMLSDVFGIEMDEVVEPKKAARLREPAVPAVVAKKSASSRVVGKPTPLKKAVLPKVLDVTSKAAKEPATQAKASPAKLPVPKAAVKTAVKKAAAKTVTKAKN